MKLLSKNEIAHKKSLERKLEIDEGAKLANRVDSLRSTSVEEEMRLQKFKEESINIVQREISILIEQRDTISNEIDVLNQERKAARIPLDAEWEKVRLKEAAIDQRDQELTDRIREFNERAAITVFKEEELQLREQQADAKQERAKELITIANSRLNALDKQDREISQKLDDANRLFVEQNNQIQSREELVAIRERNVEAKQEQVIQDRIELVNRERLINDKYATLERAEKRNA